MRGHIHKRERTLQSGKKSTLWYVVVDIPRDPDGHRRQKWHGGYTTRMEAEAIRAAIINEINRGHYILPSKLTLAEFVHESWLARLDVEMKHTSRDGYRGVMFNHVLPTLGHVSVQRLQTVQINNLLAKLQESGRVDGQGGLSAATVKTVRTVLTHALGHAYDAGLVGRNVAERAKTPRKPFRAIKDSQVWDAAQIRAFLQAVTGHRLEAAWRVAALTGIRRGELLGLRWRDIDLDRGQIRIRRALVCTRDGVIETTPKNGRERAVELDAETVSSLREHQGRQTLDKDVWDELYLDDGFVFAQENGLPIYPSSLSEAIHRIAKEAGLPHIRFHDLRHSHASIAVHAGVPITVVSERLGHSSPWFTWKQYGHLGDGVQAEAAETIARAIVGELVETPMIQDSEIPVLVTSQAMQTRRI